MARSNWLCGVVFAFALAPAAALAGPCSNDIADLGRMLSQQPGLGPAATGALSGSGPGTARGSTQPQADTAGTTATGRVGGTAGTKELNAASAQVATSPEDVRQQQEGKPTMAAQAQAGGASGGQSSGAQPGSQSVETNPQGARSSSANTGSDDKASQAKMTYQQAVDLDAKGDNACMDAVKRARDLLQAG